MERTVRLSPEKIAVIDEERRINFFDLSKKAKAIASFLNQFGFSNTPIAVYLPKSIESVCSNIAITYSANVYMNLDIKNPLERIKNVINLIKPKIIISNNQHITDLEKLTLDTSVELLNIDSFDGNIEVNEDLLQEKIAKIIDTDPYCIINTSGSTGTPKGVVLNHKSFIDFTERSLENFQFTDDEIIGSLSPIVFDIYSFELCLLMAKSSTMVLIPGSLSAFPIEIINVLAKRAVSFLFWVPTIMVNIANMDLLSQAQLPALKIIWFAGEIFPTKQFNYWRKHLSTTLFANLYGPIEITLDCTYYIVERHLNDNEPIPIGCTYKNTDILILNEHNQLVKGQEEGELCVRGSSLAMGYYNNPEKTALAFVQNPLNNAYPEIIYRTGDIVFINTRGEIIIKGRKDNLIKHLGYRIELTEIEHVLVNTLKIVDNACAVHDSPKGRIIVYYEAQEELSPAYFRKKILEHLPKYMVPTGYIKLQQLPRNTNGKIDRLALTNKALQ